MRSSSYGRGRDVYYWSMGLFEVISSWLLGINLKIISKDPLVTSVLLANGYCKIYPLSLHSLYKLEIIPLPK